MKSDTFSFQGAPGAFSHQAAIAFAERVSSGSGAAQSQFVPCQTFGEVFDNVCSGRTGYGAIPLENSSIGSIAANYDLLWSNDAVIVAEYFLPVHHNLIGLPDSKIEDVRVVFSHPAALDQCRKLFNDHPDMSARVHWDTSGAVRDVSTSRDRTLAAIAGELAATEYNMKILLPNIEDFEHNATRFGLIVRSSHKDAQLERKEGPYKISFALELKHEVGALATLLNRLAAAGANLTKIESRPIGETPWHYRFFIDMELAFPSLEQPVEAAFKETTQTYKSLGWYPSALNPADQSVP
jgi:prephenate dehydratase